LYENRRELALSHGLQSCWATPILSSDGAALGVVGIYHDRPHTPGSNEIGIVERATYLARIAIERRRFEERLEAGKEHYRELFENANDIIYTHDLAGKLTSLNKAGELLTGYTRGEALGMNIAAFVRPELRGALREMTERKIGGEPKTTYDLEILDKHGAR